MEPSCPRAPNCVFSGQVTQRDIVVRACGVGKSKSGECVGSSTGSQARPEKDPAEIRQQRRWFVRWRWWIVAGAGVVVIGLLTVFVVTNAIGQQRLADARTKYATSYSGYEKALFQVDELKDEALALIAETSPEQLADPVLLEDLKSIDLSRDIAAPISEVQDLPLEEIEAASASLEQRAKELADSLSEISRAIDAIKRSVNEKALVDAVASLSASIATAESLLERSAGRVPDDSVRAQLSRLIDDGKQALAAADSTAEAINTVRAAIDTQAGLVSAALVPQFTDVDGTWCSWEEPSQCVTIALPNVGSSAAVVPPAAGAYYPPRGDGWTYVVPGTDCFKASVMPIGGGETGGYGLTFCPRGFSTPQEARFDSPGFDRIYMGQMGSVDPMFRQEQYSSAMAEGTRLRT